jgi:hypothetical protein
MSAHALSDFGAPLLPQGNDGKEGRGPVCLVKHSAKIISAINGRNGSNIAVPPYQEIVETNYVRPTVVHWIGDIRTFDAADVPEEFDEEEILQPRRLLLRVF